MGDSVQAGALNLAAVLKRAKQLQEHLDRIIRGLHAPRSTQRWEFIVNEWAMINANFVNLVDSIRPVMEYCAVYPQLATAQNASILPIMLSTKLLPEIEAEDNAALERLGDPEGAGGGYEELSRDIDDFNALCDFLAEAAPAGGGGAEGAGMLHAQSEQRASRGLSHKQLQASVTGGAGARAGAGAGAGAAGEGAEARERLLAAVTGRSSTVS